MRSTYLFFALLFLIACSSDDSKEPQDDPTSAAYIDELVAALEGKAVNSNDIDWDEFKTVAHSYVQNPSQINEGIKRSLIMLNDPFVRAERNKTQIKPDIITDCSSSFVGMQQSKEGVGYVYLTWDEDRYNDTTQVLSILNQISMADANATKGWVLNINFLQGGKPWLLLGALGPLLDDGIKGYLVTPDGKQSPWKYEGGKVSLADKVIYDLKGNNFKPTNVSKKIAVIVDEGTNGTAEFLAISLMGQSNVKIFGNETCGRAFGLDSLVLSDKAKIWLSTTKMADRTKTIKTKVVPDEIFSTTQALTTRVLEWFDEVE